MKNNRFWRGRLCIVAAMLCLLGAVLSTGCNREADAEPVTTEAVSAQVEVKDNTTVTPGVLLVGIKPGDSPYITKNPDGSVEGFEIDLAKAIGELTLLEVRFVEMEHAGIYSELDVSGYDCVISAAQKSEAVDKVYDFSVVYYTDEGGTEYAAVVKSGNNRLLNVLNQALGILKDKGTIAELEEKWFPQEEESESTK